MKIYDVLYVFIVLLSIFYDINAVFIKKKSNIFRFNSNTKIKTYNYYKSSRSNNNVNEYMLKGLSKSCLYYVQELSIQHEVQQKGGKDNNNIAWQMVTSSKDEMIYNKTDLLTKSDLLVEFNLIKNIRAISSYKRDTLLE